MSVEKEVIAKKLKKYARMQKKHHTKLSETYSNDMESCISSIRGNLLALKNNEVNTSERYIGMEAGIRGKLNWLKKKVVRRLSFFYVQPICDQQTVYNTAATQCVEKLLEMGMSLGSKIASLERLQEQEQDIREQMQSQISQERKQFQAIRRQMRDEFAVEGKQIREELQKNSQETQKELAAVYEKLGQYAESMEIIENTGICGQLSNANSKIIRSYAQSGEDAILFYILPHIGIELKNATYLDLGANHAKELSNTYALYEKGVRGVLVETNPVLIPELKLNRSEDQIVPKCLALHSGCPVTFYILSGDGLSTPDKAAAEKMIAENPEIRIEKEVQVDTVTIHELLEQYFSEAPTFLNIDIEGMEFDILQEIDFKKIRPKVVIVEMIEYSMMIHAGSRNQRILDYMKKNNYIEYAFTGINSIFVDASVWKYTDR